MSQDLFLAMDTYCRGYSAKIDFGGASAIGGASLLAEQAREDLDYFAQAYNWNDKSVIAYRGTDNPDPTSLSSDAWQGWTVGGGYTGGQTALAEWFSSTLGLTLPVPPETVAKHLLNNLYLS